MFPVPSGIHGFGGVQAAFFAYVSLTLGITFGLWWLGMPAEMGGRAFLAVGAVLLIPFFPVFVELYPEHAEK